MRAHEFGQPLRLIVIGWSKVGSRFSSSPISCVARALVYSPSKKAAGWPAEDVKRAQSLESFSLVANDWCLVVEPACLRIQDELGVDWQSTEQALA